MAQVNQVTRGTGGFGKVAAKSITKGGQPVPAILPRVTVSVNPASIAAGAKGTTAVTVAGALTTDEVIVQPPATLEAGLVLQSAIITAANTVTLTLLNHSAGAVDAAAANWQFTLLRR